MADTTQQAIQLAGALIGGGSRSVVEPSARRSVTAWRAVRRSPGSRANPRRRADCSRSCSSSSASSRRCTSSTWCSCSCSSSCSTRSSGNRACRELLGVDQELHRAERHVRRGARHLPRRARRDREVHPSFPPRSSRRAQQGARRRAAGVRSRPWRRRCGSIGAGDRSRGRAVEARAILEQAAKSVDDLIDDARARDRSNTIAGSSRQPARSRTSGDASATPSWRSSRSRRRGSGADRRRRCRRGPPPGVHRGRARRR